VLKGKGVRKVEEQSEVAVKTGFKNSRTKVRQIEGELKVNYKNEAKH
jgi:hypothetical protein